ncbi:regulatory protein, LuxR [Fulvimarina pelagi HTCC2506]|uniref:Regulatory protein, LuxR n=1 Tax=Fulvimarina pelagi HTCC2506 TaxID=314231 RepID=Q0G3G8_9HYPH|nr:helix-turn-helix transcriptional regulator [Fulvimarina pelagi]EAU41863.1 regulatory protein, LuxR [Fulvimarina pelagi HTCC2506]
MVTERHTIPDLTYATLPALYDMTSVADGWQETLDGVAGSIETGTGAIIFGISGFDDIYRPDRVCSFFAERFHMTETWLSRFRHYEEQAERTLLGLKPGEIWTDRSTWSEEELIGRDDQLFLLNRLGTRSRYAAPMIAQDGWRAGILVHCSGQGEKIDRSAHAVLNFLSPHLSASLGLRRLISGLIAKYQAVLGVLDRISVGLMLAKGSGEIVLANEAAKSTMDRHGGITLCGNSHLRTRDERLTRRIVKAIQSAGDAAYRLNRPAHEILLSPSSGFTEPLLIEVSPMRDGAREMDRGFAGALVTIIDPNDPPTVDPQHLAALHGLSPAETAVMGLILKGYTLPAIAEVRGVSPHTARTQIRTIYRKTGADGRGSLALKAAHLRPPVL